ncbi:MAG: hypothetical protein AAGI67_13305 [Pseudomonadota bacterium]
MGIWEPFDPFSYFFHTILGGLGILGAIVALSVLKGSGKHIWAGRLFAFGALIAATTAVVFSFTEFSGAAISSSVMTFSALGAALFALRQKRGVVLWGELLTTTLMGLSFLWLTLGVVMSIESGLWLPPLLYSLFPLGLFIGDIRFLRLNQQQRSSAGLSRHFSRMAFTLAIAVHAPLVTFADELPVHPAVAFFGPFLIWPAIVLTFKRRQDKGRLALAQR